MRTLLFLATAFALPAQELYEGIGTGYDGELRHVSRQVLALAQAVPEDKYTWRPAAGILSIAEVYAHLAAGNFSLMSQMGIARPQDLPSDLPKRPKAEIVRWLAASLDALKAERAKTTPTSRERKVKFLQRIDTTADGVWLRILIHLNEHMGQSIAYARINQIRPPWSPAAEPPPAPQPPK